MKTLKMIFGLMLLVALAKPSLADGVVLGHILVKPNSGISVQNVAASYGVRVDDRVPGTDVYSLTIPEQQTEEGFAALLSTDSRLVFAEVDTYFSNPRVVGDPVHLAFDFAQVDSGFLAQWFAPLDVSLPGNPFLQINLGGAHQRTTGTGITIAVLDTGIDFHHPLLQEKILPGINMIQRESLPWESFDGTSNADVGHGTMVAGIIRRIAPGAQILPIRVLNGDGRGSANDVAKGIMFAIQNGARVINMSLTSSVRSKAIEEALGVAEVSGVTCVVAAGNLGTDERQYPTARKEVIVVGAVDSNNVKPYFSNYGKAITVVAPGVGIRSTYLYDGCASWSGTSFAAPFVSGEAALILQLKPTYNASSVKSAIRGPAHSVDQANPLYRGNLGKGIIDIDATIAKL